MFDIRKKSPPLKTWIIVSDGEYEWEDIYANFHYNKNGIKVWDITFYDDGEIVKYFNTAFYVGSACNRKPKFWRYEE